ncbi:MAG TPA: flagellar hook protein FlgE [Bryobacteraceae bacterium]|nr:flagellar hook protein FlgE [Bryobacteraceae bacterium]
MSSAYSNALSGLTANSNAINIVSGNLANLSTAGYKDQQVSFEDLVNESISGFTNTSSISGSVLAQGTQQFTQGTLETTGNPYDAAIQGGGFFVVDTTAGTPLYTRQGNFDVNAAGQLVTATGQFVQGWNNVNGTLNTGGLTSNIVVPTDLTSPPVASTQFSASANLSANVVFGATPPATFSSPVQVYDSVGNPHNLTITYTAGSTPGNWNYAITIPSADLASPTTPPTALASGTLTFDSTGTLTSPAAGSGPIAITVPTLADGGAFASALNWNLYSPTGASTLTQFASASVNNGTTQDGSSAGLPTSVGIGANGEVVAKFSNGNSEVVAQIALASVLNPDSMQQLDGNTFAPTSLTAKPTVGVPSTGALGSITGGTLETSTVDIASEFTHLLEYERGYQANSKVITTEDQVVQQTIALITG